RNFMSMPFLQAFVSLDQHHIVDCYKISPESLIENFISKISRKDYRKDRLTTATRAKRHRICLELLRICTPARDIDDRA
ncbi:741_t:CDS:2, partial [Cetraspora pellucida]